MNNRCPKRNGPDQATATCYCCGLICESRDYADGYPNPDSCDVIAHLRTELATAREKALEEAAERIDSYAAAASADDNTQALQAFEAAVAAIRALAKKEG